MNLTLRNLTEDRRLEGFHRRLEGFQRRWVRHAPFEIGYCRFRHFRLPKSGKPDLGGCFTKVWYGARYSFGLHQGEITSTSNEPGNRGIGPPPAGATPAFDAIR